jgi:HAD superfamily hydrolase (TIGR01490 family)
VNLAMFDLDNTLLGGDSDYLWGQFLVEHDIVDGELYERENRRFYEAYKAGTLDIHEFLDFALRPLASNDPNDLYRWRERFVREKIHPIMLPKAIELLHQHRDAGDTLLIITATNRFVTQPIAEALGVTNLIATEVEMKDGHFTGKSWGVPCFQNGKVQRVMAWLRQTGHSLKSSWFYSDSVNDLPLLSQVTYPVAVDPDEGLASYARKQGWRIISLRN